MSIEIRIPNVPRVDVRGPLEVECRDAWEHASSNAASHRLCKHIKNKRQKEDRINHH